MTGRIIEKTHLSMLIVALLCGFSSSVGAQSSSGAQKKGVAMFVEQAPVVDGILDEPLWEQAAPLSGFQQKDPDEGAPSSEGTAVHIVYNSEAIYFGFRCDDSQPGEIIATERRRDEDLTKDDSVAIILDTFNDSRNGFLFRTNSLGAQYDALLTDEGLDINVSWDEKWEAAANRTGSGWTAEVMIPFKSLRMGQEKEMVWGLEIERLIRRKNESVYWNTYNRNFKFEDVSQAGVLAGLENIAQGLRWRIKPFGLAGFEQVPDGRGGTKTDNLSDIGLELVKYRPTPSLTLDVTANTDFAQTEVDNLVTNITRFPLFFPEKREFFLEGAGIFEFGVGLDFRQQRSFELFFSRRIGLSPEGDVIPIIAGAKFTGRIGPYTLGVIDMQTESELGLKGSNFGVFRIKRDLFERSSVGAMFTNRQSSIVEDHNRVFGIDGNFVFADNLKIQAFLAKTETPDLPKDDWSAFGRVVWDSDFLLWGAEYLLVQRNFNPEIGFIPRRDQRKTSLQFGVRPRPESDLIRQWIIRARMDFTQNQDGKQESMQYHFFTVETLFETGDRIMIDFHRNFERLFKPFAIRPDITIPTGTYRSSDFLLIMDGAPHRSFAGSEMIRFSYQWGFFDGTFLELIVQPQIKLSEAFSVDLVYTLNDVDLPFGDFTSQVVNVRANYAFSNKWLTSTTVQYSNLDSFVNYRFRLNYIYRPGDDIFLIYNEGRNTDDLRGEGLLGRSIMLKWTYSFDF
ncbi:carbohydrate binding family 9 domain-containing protein [Acidobacteria bacterium AH-259-D05]|nr:carbohydrate binding family 9 domain-containing protein [Acidobacteria bacterium AH-259-D05]